MKTFEEFKAEYEAKHPEIWNAYHDAINEYNGVYFRDHAEVGDGVSVHLWSDSHAYTIIARTPKTLTLRRCKSIRTDSNGMSDCQDYRFEENENGYVVKAYWSNKNNRFYQNGCSVTPGHYEYFDYSF